MQKTNANLPVSAVTPHVLVMGVGNTLLQDDGVGVHIIETLRAMPDQDPAMKFIDGGTLGLSLLPDVEDAAAVIVVDAGEIGESPGTMKIFTGEDADRHLGGTKSTVHELAVADLFATASMTGNLPERRALIAIQPAVIEWGLEPTDKVKAAIPAACAAIQDLTRSWRYEA